MEKLSAKSLQSKKFTFSHKVLKSGMSELSFICPHQIIHIIYVFPKMCEQTSEISSVLIIAAHNTTLQKKSVTGTLENKLGSSKKETMHSIIVNKYFLLSIFIAQCKQHQQLHTSSVNQSWSHPYLIMIIHFDHQVLYLLLSDL